VGIAKSDIMIVGVVMKITPTGDIMWSKIIQNGNTTMIHSYGCAVTSDAYFVVGFLAPYLTIKCSYLLRIEASRMFM
jgi:hypothetical protein